MARARTGVVVAERFAASLVVAALGGIGFGLVLLLVRWSPVGGVDQLVADWANRVVAGDDGVTAVLRSVTRLGDTPVLLFVGGLGVLWLLVRGRRREAVYVAVTALGAGVLGLVVKEAVGRLRPLVEVAVATAPGPSFPSGHALGSSTTYGVLLLVFGSVRRVRVVAGPVVVAAVVAVGVTRVALGVHFLTDVLAGWLLGLLWLGLTAEAFRRWRRDVGLRDVPLAHGVAPEAADDLRPVPRGHVPALVHPWRVAAELLVVWALLLCTLFGLGHLLTAAGPDVPTRFDRAVSTWFAERRTPFWDSALTPFSTIGGTSVVVAGAVVVCVVALAVARAWRPLVLVVTGMLGEITLFLLITAIVDRARPATRSTDDLPPTSSFPSGHVAATLVLGALTAYLVLAGTRHRWRWVVVAICVAVPLLVCLQRLYAGLHHPTDVLGSALLAAVWVPATIVLTASGTGRAAAAPPLRGGPPRG
ncbi:phosphatase PAP2 family protein [Saccharothrix longispora]|uniref:Undecaprenyl-diphosphatase n=1 Tax=Saccharothrix longispora TaxID=33920 RepID=A0ABU1PVU9_9PSEU|nr:phosphatase PAP2 family protein [Saccharothrix longispora]MDR6594770.1 undecaprenyl-diphosphatase [Saccharothrix longispora]